MSQFSSTVVQEQPYQAQTVSQSPNTNLPVGHSPAWYPMDHQVVVRSMEQTMEGRIVGTNGKKWEFHLQDGLTILTGQRLLFQLTTPFSRFEEEGVIQRVHAVGSIERDGSPGFLAACLELTLSMEALKRTFPQPGDAELTSPLSSFIFQLYPMDGPTEDPTHDPFRCWACQIPLESTTLTPSDPSPTPVEISSALIQCRNTRGETIVGYHDHPHAGLPALSPVVVLMPGYGETKREYVTLAHYLANNGCHVVRYDHTNHVGESDGGHEGTTLSKMREDLQAMLNFVEHTWTGHPVALVATSLAGRVAIKELASNRRVELLVLIAGIIDVRATLQAVHQEDLVGDYHRGIPKGITNILGFNVDLDEWMADAVQQDYADLASTVADIRHLQARTICFTGGQDAWIDSRSMDFLFSAASSPHMQGFHIPEAMHRLLENPVKARLVYRKIVDLCRTQFSVSSPHSGLTEPSKRAIGIQKKLERERNKARMGEMNLAEFWKDYLDHFHYIKNLSDYHQLLDHIAERLGPVHPGERLLDAGCGNGNFAKYLHRRLAKQPLPDGEQPVRYLGADLVPDALRHAQTLLTAHVSEETRDMPEPPPSFVSSFAGMDLNSPLPFQDGQFDKIVCNLVLGYLDNPEQTLREFVRILAPGGRLVLTNLKPNADLSMIYQNFVERTSSPLEVEEGRQLLSNSGKIRHAEENGIFQFNEGEELAALMTKVNDGQPTEIASTFANQALIAVLVKSGPSHISTLDVHHPAKQAA